MTSPPALPAARLPHVHPDRCTGCGRCVAACPTHVLVLEPVRWVKLAALADPDGCTGCADCAAVCPFRAITMRRADAPLPGRG